MSSDHTNPALDQGFSACADKLTDFGYHGITPEMIRSAHTNWLAGGQADDIIEKFAFGDFAKHPEIFGTKNG